MQTSDPNDFQNLMRTSLSKVTFVVELSQISDHFFQRYESNCGKMSYFVMLKNPFKKFLDPDPEADDFQNLISSSLPTVQVGVICWAFVSLFGSTMSLTLTLLRTFSIVLPKVALA